MLPSNGPWHVRPKIKELLDESLVLISEDTSYRLGGTNPIVPTTWLDINNIVETTNAEHVAFMVSHTSLVG